MSAKISNLDNKIKPSGTMAISNKARELRAEGKSVISFGAGEPDFPTPEYIVEDVKKAASDPTNHKYSPAAGLEGLRNEISRTTKEYSKFKVDPSNIVVTNGGKQAILTAFLSVLDPEDEVIIPSPFWTTYPESVKIAGGNPVTLETTNTRNQ